METFAGLAVQNTKDVINEYTRFAMLCFADPGTGKTRLGATLDKLTRKYMDKPTIAIACEPGEGGGTMSIRESELDFVVPQSVSDISKILTHLKSDTKYGGVLFDSSTDMVNRFLKPWAIKQPCREKNGAVLAARELGVPARGDYQSMGEQMRTWLNQLINLTSMGDAASNPKLMENRKHVYVTATLRVRTDDNDNVTAIGPDLPGALMSAAPAMFQTVTTIMHKIQKDDKGARVLVPYLTAKPKTKELIKDRTGLLPDEAPMDFLEIYEKYWLTNVNKENKNEKS